MPAKIIDLSGQRFGKLSVVSFADTAKGVSRWLCKCDCGNEKIIRSDALKNGTKSCGCHRIDLLSNAQRKKPYYSLYARLLRQSKRRKYDVQITYEDFLEFTKIPNCEYCGNTVPWEPYGHNKGYNLDRKNSKIGYVKENLAVCCKVCNQVKSNIFNHQEMLKLGSVIKDIFLQRNALN